MVQGCTQWPQHEPGSAWPPAGLLATVGPSRAMWTVGVHRGEQEGLTVPSAEVEPLSVCGVRTPGCLPERAVDATCAGVLQLELSPATLCLPSEAAAPPVCTPRSLSWAFFFPIRWLCLLGRGSGLALEAPTEITPAQRAPSAARPASLSARSSPFLPLRPPPLRPPSQLPEPPACGAVLQVNVP